MWGSESLTFPQRKAVLARHNYTKIRIKPCLDLLPIRFLLRHSPLSPLAVLSTSFFPACYPFVVALTVCCFVYTCVYSCVPTCTLLYTRVYTEAFITTSFRGSPQLYEWALLGCIKGLVPAQRKGSCQLGGWMPLCSTEGFVPARRKGSCQLHRWLFSAPSLCPYK